MRALQHLLDMPAPQLAVGSLTLLFASTCAAIIVFMIGFRMAGMPAGAVWVLLGVVRSTNASHDASLDDILERRSRDDSDSLQSLGRTVAAAGAGHKVGEAKPSVGK